MTLTQEETKVEVEVEEGYHTPETDEKEGLEQENPTRSTRPAKPGLAYFKWNRSCKIMDIEGARAASSSEEGGEEGKHLEGFMDRLRELQSNGSLEKILPDIKTSEIPTSSSQELAKFCSHYALHALRLRAHLQEIGATEETVQDSDAEPMIEELEQDEADKVGAAGIHFFLPPVSTAATISPEPACPRVEAGGQTWREHALLLLDALESSVCRMEHDDSSSAGDHANGITSASKNEVVRLLGEAREKLLGPWYLDVKCKKQFEDELVALLSPETTPESVVRLAAVLLKELPEMPAPPAADGKNDHPSESAPPVIPLDNLVSEWRNAASKRREDERNEREDREVDGKRQEGEGGSERRREIVGRLNFANRKAARSLASDSNVPPLFLPVSRGETAGGHLCCGDLRGLMGEGAESDKLREDDVMESEVALRCMTLVAYQYAKHVGFEGVHGDAAMQLGAVAAAHAIQGMGKALLGASSCLPESPLDSDYSQRLRTVLPPCLTKLRLSSAKKLSEDIASSLNPPTKGPNAPVDKRVMQAAEQDKIRELLSEQLLKPNKFPRDK